MQNSSPTRMELSYTQIIVFGHFIHKTLYKNKYLNSYMQMRVVIKNLPPLCLLMTSETQSSGSSSVTT